MLNIGLIRSAALGVAALAALAVVATAPGPAEAQTSCGSGTCVRLDMIPGGGVDSSVNVSGGFGVDLVLEDIDPSLGAAAFQATIVYDRGHLSAGTPIAFVPGDWDCSTLAPSADLNEDGDPNTGEAFVACFAGGPGVVHDGPIARFTFSTNGGKTSSLTLKNTVVADAAGGEAVSCNPVVVNSAGGCTNGTVTSTGAPPPPPGPPGPPPGPPPSADTCTVDFVIDGETVHCTDGSRVRFIGVGSPLGADAGSEWARAVTNWFLLGKTVYLEFDALTVDEFGSRFAYPHVIGTDGADYNISALLIFVGMARHFPDGQNNMHVDWFNAAEVWARTACWNMWDGGNPWGAEAGCF